MEDSLSVELLLPEERGSPDASNPNEKVVSEHATYHVYYSQPTNLSLTKSNNPDFTKLQYEYDQEQQIQAEEPSQLAAHSSTDQNGQSNVGLVLVAWHKTVSYVNTY
jgi:hypothetical protein